MAARVPAGSVLLKQSAVLAAAGGEGGFPLDMDAPPDVQAAYDKEAPDSAASSHSDTHDNSETSLASPDEDRDNESTDGSDD